MDKYELYNKILKSTNTIAKNSRSGAGNFIIISSHVANILNGYDGKKELQELRKKKIKNIIR